MHGINYLEKPDEREIISRRISSKRLATSLFILLSEKLWVI